MKTKLKLQNIFSSRVLNPVIFFKDNKGWFKLTFIVFCLAFLGGIITFLNPSINIFYPIVKSAFSDLSKVAEEIKNLNFFDKALFIFINNVSVVGVIIIGGLVFGILPLFVTILNGLILGFFFSMIIFSNITIYVKILMILSLIPHGIVELYSIFTSISYSLKLSLSYLLPKSKGKRIKIFINNLKEAPAIILFVVLGLSLAAIIEVLDMIILKALVE